jgi:type I restriction enzyme S subunit
VSYFNKTVASKDMSGYYLLKNGEFAYNKSYSVGYDFGSIKRLDRYPMGALSTLYICFALKRHESDFIKAYFDSLKWYREIYMISAEGARNHGLLNVPTEEFFDTKHYLPENTDEQRKIADFLIALDRRIETQQSLVDNLKKYKRGVIQRVFSGRKGNGKDHCPTWEVSSFGEFFTEQIIKTSNSPDTPLVSLTVEDGITPKTERYYREFLITKEGDNYKAIKPGWFAYNPMNAHLGAIAANHLGYTAAVSGYYNIFSANETDTISFWEEYLTSYPMLIHYKLIATGSLIEKQRVHYSQFVGIRRCLPSVEEQKHLSKLFEAVNKKIANAESMERQLVRMRVSLLQQLFI